MKKRVLSLLLAVLLVVSLLPTAVMAEGNGNLEFTVSQNDHIGTDGKSIEYANGYKLAVSYTGIGENRISMENGHTELRNIPNGTSVTFTLTVPDGQTKVPDLKLSDAKETFVNNIVTTNLNFSQNSVIRVELDFGGNPGSDDPTYSVDFGTASWTIDETTVTASVNGKVLTSGAVELTDDDEIVLTNFNPETMKANLVATDGFTTTLIVTNGVTHMNSLPDDVHLPSGTLTFSVSKMQDNPGPGPGQDEGHIVKLQINNHDGANGSVSCKFDTEQDFTKYTATNDNGGNIRLNIPEGSSKVTFKAAPGGRFVIQDCTILHGDQDIDENKAYMNGVKGAGYEYTLPNDDKTIVFRADFGDELPTWNTVSWGGGNVEIKYGQVKAYAVHVGDKTYDENVKTADETNKRYPLSDITKVDIQTYGVSFGGTDLFIAEGCTEDVSIDFRFIPDYGYQVTDVRATEDSLLSQFAPGEEISTFHFTYIPKTNVHFIVNFTKTNDIINSEGSRLVTGAAIENGGNAINSGNLKMNIADVTPENVSDGLKNAVGETGAQYLDMTLSQVVSKTGENGDWENRLTELDGSIGVSLAVTDLDPNEEYVIIREHRNGDGSVTYDEIPVTYNSETNTITFATDKFSTYALVKRAFSGTHTHGTGTEAITFSKAINTFGDLQDLFANGGSGYLAADITATAGLTVAANVELCLNDKKLDLDQKGNITVSSGKTLNLYDCGTNGTITGGKGFLSGSEYLGGGVYVAAGGAFVMNGGTISDCEATKGGGVFTWGNFTMNNNSEIVNCTATVDGGGVCACNCAFIMNDSSKVSNCTAGNGAGGVYTFGNDTTNPASFTMNGNSTISECKASANYSANQRNGGGVSVEGSIFTMNGGTISRNEAIAKEGGGVSVYNGTFEMNSGTIVGNKAKSSSGGVHVMAGANFNMNGGTINGNTAGFDGGGVYVTGGGNITMTGGSITGNHAVYYGGGLYYSANGTVTLGGDAKITGNTAGSENKPTNNLYLLSNKQITLGTKSASNEGNGVAPPTDGFKVGVTTQTAPTDTAPVKITTNGASTDTNYFASDNDAYEVKHNTGHLELAVKTTPYTPSEPTIVVPVSGGEEKVEVSATVSGEKATVGDISEKDIEKVVSGDKGDAVIEIDLSGLDKTISEVALPVKTVEKIAEATQASGKEEAGMSVKMSAATVTFDAKATQAMVDQAEGNTIQLVVDDIKTVSLNAVQKEAVEKLDTAIIIDAYLVSNGIKLCTESKNGFAGGKATVALQYEIKNNRTPLNYKVFYVDDNGKLTNLKAKYNEETKSFVFDIEHFSNYAVAYDENGELQASKVNLTKTTTYKNGKIKLTFKRLKLSDGKKVTSYQIYRSTSKKFNKNLKKYSIKRTANTKTYTWTNSKKLKKGTKYYYKVRGRVKLSDGTYAYTKWSNVKTAKCKKSR